VWKHLHAVQGGSLVYPVASFTDTKVVISPVGGGYPKPYEQVLVDYVYDRYETVVAEVVTSDGTPVVVVQGTEIDRQDSHDPENVAGDLVEVTRVQNMTLTRVWTYAVKSFDRQAIYLNTNQPGYVAPHVGDRLEVDYRYCPPTKVAIEMYEDRETLEKMGHDLKIGDVMATLPSYFEIGQGDIVTLLFARSRREIVVTRGVGAWDELPAFDVVKAFDGVARGGAGEVYREGVNFRIQQFSQLYWLTGAPVTGKKYTLSIIERPTFRVFQTGAVHNFAENQHFPQKCTIRRYERASEPEEVRVDR